MEKDAAGCRALNRNYIVGGYYIMEIKTVWSVYFSATGTTEKVVTTLA